MDQKDRNFIKQIPWQQAKQGYILTYSKITTTTTKPLIALGFLYESLFTKVSLSPDIIHSG